MGKKNKLKAKKNKGMLRFFIIIGLILLFGYVTISLISSQLEIKRLEKAEQTAITEYESIISENAYLEQVSNGDKSEYIKRLARERLGYVAPNERVFYNTTPGA